jgi:hypothetical protein
VTAAQTPFAPGRPGLPDIDPRSARLTVESAVVGLVFGTAVVAPWAGGGYLLLLDWVSGPHQAITPGLYGLDPAALDALPYRLVTQAVREVVGPGITGWLMVLLYFPVAAGGVSALCGGGRWRRHVAALYVVCNPFVVERIRAGHVTFLLSVSLVAWLLASAVRARRWGKPFAARPAGWYALAMSVAPHAAWLGGAGLLAVAFLPRPRRTDLIRTVLVILSAGCVYAYALAVMLSAILTAQVSDADLDEYRPLAGPGGLLPTLATLHGFWRGTPSAPDDGLGPVLAALMPLVLVVAVVAGLTRLNRRDPVLGVPLTALTLAGLLLGAGVDGPLGGLYRAALRTVPLFEAMREQQKWVALAMLGYAVAVGVAAEALAKAVRRPRRASVRLPAAGGMLAVCGIFVAVAPSLIWGLGGTVQASRYPRSWYAADRLMGDGTASVLFLPWHQYQPFAFTDQRAVSTPAAAFFRRPVISSDAVELGAVRTSSPSRRTAYLDRLIAAGGHGNLGRLVAPLGVDYVVLARDREADAYGWLDRQRDLRPVLRSPELDLYRVEAPGTGRVVAARKGGYQEVVALAERGQLGSEAVLVDGPTQGSLPSAAHGALRRVGSTRWRVEPGEPGWVVLPEEWSPGWRTAAGPVRATVAGTIAVRAGAGTVTVEYVPWRWLRLGIAASSLAFAVLVAGGVVEHRRELAGWWSRAPAKVRRR